MVIVRGQPNNLGGSGMDALVTCMYNGLAGTRYGGRLNRDAMYRESLMTIAKTGLPIFCFVPEVDIPGHQAYFQACPTDIAFVPLELHDVPYHPQIQRIKSQDPQRYAEHAWRERCVEIMWGKFFMLRQILDSAPHAENVYWIDAGLANANIISTKYISESDLVNHRLSEVGAAFPPKLFRRIREFAGDKIFALKTPNGHNPGIPSKYNSRPYAIPDALIAGLLGGPRDRIAELCALFREKVEAILEDQTLFFEESILTGIYADHPELFQSFTFDTWFHEGWESFDPNLVNFSQFFDLMLETPAPDRIVTFPRNETGSACARDASCDRRRSFNQASSMITTEDIVDLTLHHMGRTGLRAFLVVIGAMDGVTFDDFHGYIDMYQWSGLFVEPIPEQFRRLRENYANQGCGRDNKYENSAIADYDGTIRMLTINQDAVDEGKVHPCFGGMSAIYPPRNGLASAGDAATVAQYGELIEVSCITLPTLFKRHAIDHVDVLCLDAEGWDYKIIEQFDFSAYRPKLIRCEYINLTADEQSALVRLLTDNGYVIRIDGQNIDAVATEYWQKLKAERPTLALSVASGVRPGNLTVVTSVFDLSSGDPDMRLRRGFALYLDNFKRLLNVSWPMVIFAQPEFHEMIRRSREPSNTYIVDKSLADLERFPFYDQVQEIRRMADGLDQSRTRRRLEYRLPLYNPFVMSKQFFLNDAAIYNPFGTEYFLWVDGDISAAIGDPLAQFTEECERNIAAMLGDHRMLYVCRPMLVDAEGPGSSKSRLAELAGQEPKYLVRGRIFGGTRRVVNAINGIYYGHLSRSLNAGYMGTEEDVLTITCHTHRPLCNLQMLGPDGRLRKFFDSLQHGVPDQADSRS